MNQIPMTIAEISARLVAERKLKPVRHDGEKRVNILHLDNLNIIRALGQKNLEVWEVRHA